MDKTTLDIWVGLFVAIGIAALMGLAMKVGNLTSNTLGETYMVTANYENIGGLKPRHPLKVQVWLLAVLITLNLILKLTKRL